MCMFHHPIFLHGSHFLSVICIFTNFVKFLCIPTVLHHKQSEENKLGINSSFFYCIVVVLCGIEVIVINLSNDLIILCLIDYTKSSK